MQKATPTKLGTTNISADKESAFLTKKLQPTYESGHPQNVDCCLFLWFCKGLHLRRDVRKGTEFIDLTGCSRWCQTAAHLFTFLFSWMVALLLLLSASFALSITVIRITWDESLFFWHFHRTHVYHVCVHGSDQWVAMFLCQWHSMSLTPPWWVRCAPGNVWKNMVGLQSGLQTVNGTNWANILHDKICTVWNIYKISVNRRNWANMLCLVRLHDIPTWVNGTSWANISQPSIHLM